MMSGIEKSYGATSYGQVHARELAPEGREIGAPLVCLHPAPSSGLYFTTVMPLLNADRRVIAPDYPGYGGSDALDEPPVIADYATAMFEFLDDIGINGRVDILGFHTGCLVGNEMALAAPERVRRLVLCDVPYFSAEQQEKLRAQMTQPMPVNAELDCLAGPWKFNIESRVGAVPMDRAFELFAEHLRAGRNDNFGFAAAFSYDCEARFPALEADVVLLATQSALHAPTVAASKVIRGATFTDVPEVTTAVFEAGADAIAKRILEALA